MGKAVTSLIIGFILIVAAVGYAYQLINKAIDVNTTLMFMLQVLIVYLLLENIKLK